MRKNEGKYEDLKTPGLLEKILTDAKICEKQVSEERNVLSEEVVEESQNG